MQKEEYRGTINRETRGGGAGGDIHVFVLTKTKRLNGNILSGKHLQKKRKFSERESFLYKYSTCIELIKNMIVHTRNTNIPIHCRTKPMMHPIH